MKEINKNEKAITLIALIITIIILVVLAAVSIRAITNMGIVGYAVNGAYTEYTTQYIDNNEIVYVIDEMYAYYSDGHLYASMQL